jgi:hypothetical protein
MAYATASLTIPPATARIHRPPIRGGDEDWPEILGGLSTFERPDPYLDKLTTKWVADSGIWAV